MSDDLRSITISQEATIDRLNAEIKRLILSRETWVNKCADRSAIIAELVTALSRYIDTQSENRLLERALDSIK